jgi:iron complex transport system ATP-binding protein
LLRVDSVSFSYELGATRASVQLVLERISFDVGERTIVGLLGPNGSGKTTLLRLMSGTLSPLEGRVTIDGIDAAKLARRDLARQVALVPQDTQTTFDFSVLDMVLMGRYPHLGTFELEDARDLAVARDALAAVGATHLESRRFGTLSGGEKQRVVIAGALAQASNALLLDEPTASLDLRYQLDIGALLRRLNQERGTTMVLSTHDLNLAAALCSDLVLLRGGHVVSAGPVAQVLTPANIRAVYDVEADIQFHPRAGRMTVVPIARAR